VRPLDRIVATERTPLSLKVVRNVGISVARVVLVLPIQFFIIPYILKKVGVEGYGTWTLFLVVVQSENYCSDSLKISTSRLSCLDLSQVH
jgi:hypothetical protein